MENIDLSGRYLQIDILKAFAIISVLLLHSLAIIFFHSDLMIFKIIIPLTIVIAVPLFFVLMGRNAGASFKRKNLNSFKSIFTNDYFKARFMRIVFPIIIVGIVSAVCGFILGKNMYFGILTVLGHFPFPYGYDWGNYFVSITIQFIFIFPFLYYLYTKSPKMMLIVSFAVNLIFELFANTNQVFANDSYIYRASIFRYLFVISLGLWVMDKVDSDTEVSKFLLKYKLVLIGLLLSVLFILLNSLLGWFVPYLQQAWQPHNLFSAFYPLIICVVGLKYLPKKASNKTWNYIAHIGKASYHIFLVQIIYFAAITPFIFDNNLLWGSMSPILTIVIILSNVVVSLILGLIFFSLESKLAFKILKFKNPL